MHTFEFSAYAVQLPNRADRPEGYRWVAYCMDPVPIAQSELMTTGVAYEHVGFERLPPVYGETKDDALQQLKHRIRSHFDNLKMRGVEVEKLELPLVMRAERGE